jgi:hypothetical protein
MFKILSRKKDHKNKNPFLLYKSSRYNINSPDINQYWICNFLWCVIVLMVIKHISYNLPCKSLIFSDMWLCDWLIDWCLTLFKILSRKKDHKNKNPFLLYKSSRYNINSPDINQYWNDLVSKQHTCTYTVI